MPEPLKNIYNKTMISLLARELKNKYKPFDVTSFKSSIFETSWDKKELKQRMRHVTETLHKHLPDDFEQALGVLKPVSLRFSGFEYMIFPDYGDYQSQRKMVARQHSFRKITTRKYYSGTHYLSVIINGIIMAKISFALT